MTWTTEDRERYRGSTEYHAQKSLESYHRRKAWLDSIKLDQGCADCGYDEHPAALDFHHLPGTHKCFSLGRAHNHSLRAVKAEIKKCEIVCANCHRIRHANDNEDADQ